MVYLDVFANAPPIACFNRSHAHPPGRGRWWVAEINRTIAALKSAKDGVRLVESECFNEALGATLDSNLIWTDRLPWECPMLGSIYGGWLDWNGSLDYQSENMITFTARLARRLLGRRDGRVVRAGQLVVRNQRESCARCSSSSWPDSAVSPRISSCMGRWCVPQT